jgi:hypothetical protein
VDKKNWRLFDQQYQSHRLLDDFLDATKDEKCSDNFPQICQEQWIDGMLYLHSQRGSSFP